MAIISNISIDWGTSTILVPKSAMVLVQSTPNVVYQLDVFAFKVELGNQLDDTDGMSYTDIFSHNPPVSVGGVELARVLQILSPYTVTFENGQYSVNLTGANNNVADRVNTNQVSIRTSNSAGLVTSQAIEFGEYGAQVTLDTVNGLPGALYPTGTLRQPSNNLADAKLIAAARGFSRIKIIGNFTFAAADVLDGFEMHGESPAKSWIYLTDAATITNCAFLHATVTGALDGGCDLDLCTVDGLLYIDGTIHDCQINQSAMSINGTRAEFIRCWSGVPGSATPHIDMGGTGTDLLVRDWSGGLKLSNYTSGTNAISIDITSGHIIIDSTVTAGVFTFRGLGKLTDNSGPGATVDRDNLINRAVIASSVWDQPIAEHTIVGSVAEALATTSTGGVSAATIANAVWNADIASHTTAGTFGYTVGKKLLSLAKFIGLK